MRDAEEEICYLSISELGRRLRGGALSAQMLTEVFLTRIEKVDAHTRSYARVMGGSARVAAERADAELRMGLDRGALHGIPVAIKDLIDTQGTVTAAGMAINVNRVPEEDSTIVERLKAAGAVLLGKLTMTEGAMLAHHPSVPAPRNPWHPDHDPGFSSSGSGVAVAAGLCAAALGSDTGGSIRVPSACNGVTGLKPTWGRVTRHGVWPLVEYLDTVGPMARTAGSAAAVLAAIAGADPRDPSAEAVPVPDYLGELDQGVSELAVGVDWDRIEAECDTAVVAGLHHVADVLVSRGARLRMISFPKLDLQKLMPIILAGIVDAHRALYPARRDEYGPMAHPSLEAGLTYPAMDVAASINLANVFRAQLRALFYQVDLILTPCLATTAPPAGTIIDQVARDPGSLFRSTWYTAPFNLSGSPTITFPTGFAGGLPTSAQIVAPHFAESLLFRAGRAFQSVTDWHLRQPPVPPSALPWASKRSTLVTPHWER